MTLPAPPADAGPDILCSELVRIFTAQGVEVQALQGLELRVERGEMVALVGASGSGKSTLLTILAGLDTPTAGRAQVAGHDLVTMRGAERLRYQRSSVGFVWQQSARNLLPYLSAAENIGMAHAVAGVVDEERVVRVGVPGVAERVGGDRLVGEVDRGGRDVVVRDRGDRVEVVGVGRSDHGASMA